MTSADRLARVPATRAFAFAPDGGRAARLTDRAGDLAVEVVDLRYGTAVVAFGPDPLVTPDTQLAFIAPSRLLVCGRRGAGYRIVEVATRAVTDVTAESLRLAGDLMIAYTDGVSTISRFDTDPPRPRVLARVPGRASGGVWLEPHRRLAVNLPDGGYVVDLHARTYGRWFHIRPDSVDRIVCFDEPRGRLGVTTDWNGSRRIGIAHTQPGRPIRFLPGTAASVDLCGWTEQGLLLRRRGFASDELLVADTSTLRVSARLRLPTGVVGDPVRRIGDRLHFPFSGPALPTACASYLLSGDRFELDERPDLAIEPDGLATPEVVAFPGPSGMIETLRYEPVGHRRRDLTVVALPEPAAVGFRREPQLFAGLGATVLVPNCHGVEDVIAILVATTEESGAPRVLYGGGVGADRALLVAASRPWLVDAVVAVAPADRVPDLPVRLLVRPDPAGGGPAARSRLYAEIETFITGVAAPVGCSR